MALAPEQVMVLLEAADHTPSPWLGTWTVLAAATGARNGELCGLEWSDQAWTPAPSGSARPSSLLTHILLDTSSVGDGDNGGVSGRRKELAVGRKVHCQQRHRFRLAMNHRAVCSATRNLPTSWPSPTSSPWTLR
jgi:hypothetical protein